MKVGDRVRVLKGTVRYANKTGTIVEDDGQRELNLWVLLDDEPDDTAGTPFGEHELRVIEQA